MANKISVIIDATTDKAISSLKNFRTSIAEADGAAGKMQAGFGAATGFIKANAAALAVTAGTALVTFGAKAVAEFQKVALAAGQFSDATGVGVEDASRWIEVAGDIGIGADTLEAAIGKMNKTAGASPALFEKFGAEIVRANNGTVDANETFLAVVDRLNKIKDPAEKARAATALLGRGWQDMAGLIGQGSGALKASLAGVSDAKVIDPGELQKARDFRARMDDLKDTFEDVALTLGEKLAPMLVRLAKTAVPAVEVAATATSAWDGFFSMMSGQPDLDINDWIGFSSISELKELGFTFDEIRTALLKYNGGLEYGSEKGKEYARIYGERVVPALNDVEVALTDAELATADLETAYTNLTNKWSDESAYLSVLDALDQYRWKMAEGKLSTREQEQATLDLKGKYGDLIQKMDEVPPEVKTSLLAQVDRANFDVVQSTIDYLTRDRFVKINGVIAGTADAIERSQQKPPPGRASGGLVTSGTTYLVGEKGPELLTMGAQSGVITPNSALGGAGGNTTVIIYTNADPNSTKAALRRFERRNGPGL